MTVLLREAAGYAVASACALLVDMSVLWGLIRFGRLGYEPAAAIAFLAGCGVAYAVSIRIAFTRRRLRDRRAEFAGFVAVGMVGLAVNAAVMYVGVSVLALQVMAAKCIAACFTFTCNFICRRQILFVGAPFRR